MCNTDNIYSYFDEVYKDNIKKTIIKKLKKNKQLYHQIKHFFQEEEKPVFYEMKHMIVLLKNIDKLRTIDARDNKIKELSLAFKNNAKTDDGTWSQDFLNKYHLETVQDVI